MSTSPGGAEKQGLDLLLPWVEEACAGKVTNAKLASGGNRCWGWLVDVQDSQGRALPLFMRYQAFQEGSGGPYTTRREAEIYAALRGTGVRLPQLVAVHPTLQAMITERAIGSAEYRAIKSPEERATIATEFVEALAVLHRVDAAKLELPSLGRHATIKQAVDAELQTWRSMYLATGREDPLIEFGYAWLQQNSPDVHSPPVVVHGDAGPGNLMFDQGHLTQLIDWELAHLGDPMEDLAWLAFRSVMAPVPDLPQRLREYESAAGTPVAMDRLLFHRVFVSWRILIIRHCNASGDVGPSIISRALNRRLIVEAIAEVVGDVGEPFVPMVPVTRTFTDVYDRVLGNLRDSIVPLSSDGRVVVKAKDSAKAIKFLRQIYVFGDEVERRESAALAEVLGSKPSSLEAGRAVLSAKMRDGTLSLGRALRYFRESAALETQLAADTMGSLAARHFDRLTH